MRGISRLACVIGLGMAATWCLPTGALAFGATGHVAVCEIGFKEMNAT